MGHTKLEGREFYCAHYFQGFALVLGLGRAPWQWEHTGRGYSHPDGGGQEASQELAGITFKMMPLLAPLPKISAPLETEVLNNKPIGHISYLNHSTLSIKQQNTDIFYNTQEPQKHMLCE